MFTVSLQQLRAFQRERKLISLSLSDFKLTKKVFREEKGVFFGSLAARSA